MDHWREDSYWLTAHHALDTAENIGTSEGAPANTYLCQEVTVSQTSHTSK